MKHGKKLTRNEKKLLFASGYNPLNYLTVKRLCNEIHFINREDYKLLILKLEV